jgi:hypothetical protein
MEGEKCCNYRQYQGIEKYRGKLWKHVAEFGVRADSEAGTSRKQALQPKPICQHNQYDYVRNSVSLSLSNRTVFIAPDSSDCSLVSTVNTVVRILTTVTCAKLLLCWHCAREESRRTRAALDAARRRQRTLEGRRKAAVHRRVWRRYLRKPFWDLKTCLFSHCSGKQNTRVSTWSAAGQCAACGRALQLQRPVYNYISKTGSPLALLLPNNGGHI